jgi:hypothetical protein
MAALDIQESGTNEYVALVQLELGIEIRDGS